ncbi:MAG: fructose-bisphosphate aldolase class I [Gemmatimonadota bacterium]|nr:fructose-bisphosphate aldolase class I [Gemmatimonadota bacterium]
MTDWKALENTAKALVAPGKGILAADESFPTIEKRFKSIDIPSTEENRQAYRQMLFQAPGMENFVSGVILFDETLRQLSTEGERLAEILSGKGVIPGIKVDMGAKDLAGFPGEKVTEGLDGLRGRLQEYYSLGARFAKWRAVITIGDDIPSEACIHSNAHALARYAALCQEADLVPIVEPEVLMDGDHSIERCAEVTDASLKALYSELARQNVKLEGTLLKPNMVISGKGCSTQADVEQVARETVRILKGAVPEAVPGIVFLSGGQSSQAATAHLSAMNRIGGNPWELSFSYGRALQDDALKTWAGNPANVAKAQEAFTFRAKMNGAARDGSYTEEMEQAA